MKSKNVLIESYIALTRHAKIHHAINGFITKQGLYIPRSNLLEESGILQALYWKQFFQTGVNIWFSFRKMGQDIIKSSWFYEMDMMSRTKGSQSEGLASISAMYKPCTTRNSDSRKKSLMSSSKMYSVMNLVYTRLISATHFKDINGLESETVFYFFLLSQSPTFSLHGNLRHQLKNNRYMMWM